MYLFRFAKCVCDHEELDDAWLKIAEKITSIQHSLIQLF